jgi:hypothetical protein
MSGGLSDKQKWLLALAFDYEERHDGEPAPIAGVLDTAFFSYSNRLDTDAWKGRESALRKSELFQTRRAIQALIRRGLMDEVGRMTSQTGGPDYAGPGRYNPKGYTRLCKTYRLTNAGRVIGKAEDEAIKARVKATEEANPKLKETAQAAKQATEPR